MTLTLMANFTTKAAASKAIEELVFLGFDRAQINLSTREQIRRSTEETPGKPGGAVRMHNRAVETQTRQLASKFGLTGALLGGIVAVLVSSFFRARFVDTPILHDVVSSAVAGVLFFGGFATLIGAVVGITKTDDSNVDLGAEVQNEPVLMSLNVPQAQIAKVSNVIEASGGHDVREWSTLGHRHDPEQIHGIQV